jgi:hypothetical protein
MQNILDSILSFLPAIGLLTQEGSVPPESFLPGIWASQGTLVFDRAKLRWPGDLLHEAGYIATTPAALRSQLDDALDSLESVPQAGEAEATAWAYAAIVHLRLDPAVLFHERTSLVFIIRLNQYLTLMKLLIIPKTPII